MILTKNLSNEAGVVFHGLGYGGRTTHVVLSRNDFRRFRDLHSTFNRRIRRRFHSRTGTVDVSPTLSLLSNNPVMPK